MADDIKVIIEAVLKSDDFKKGLKEMTSEAQKSTKQQEGFLDTLKSSWLKITAGITAAIVVIRQVISVTTEFINAAVQQNQALEKLNAYAKNLGINFSDVKKAAQDLSANGLLPFSDVAQALSNLLAKGFNLKQASDLIQTFTDNAIIARPAHLGLAEAVVKTTEGIKNENSILTDSSGIQKNYAKIVEEGAKKLGIQVTALTDAQKVQILYNGFMTEGSVLAGQAAKQAGTYAGQQATLASTTTMLNAAIGEQLLPFVQQLTSSQIENIKKIKDWITQTEAITRALIVLQAIGTVIYKNFKIYYDLFKVLFSPFIEGIKATINSIEIMGDDSLTTMEKLKKLKDVGIGAFIGVKDTVLNSVTDIKDIMLSLPNIVLAAYEKLQNLNKITIEQTKADTIAAVNSTKYEIYKMNEKEIEDTKKLKEDLKEFEKKTREDDLSEYVIHLENMKIELDKYWQAIGLTEEEYLAKRQSLNQATDEAIMKTRIKNAQDTLNIISQIENQISGIYQQYLTTYLSQLDFKLKQDKIYADKKRINGQLSEEEFRNEMTKLDEEYENKKRKAMQDSFYIEKALKIATATITGAQAVLTALATPPVPNIPLGIAMGALAATQIGLIAAQQAPSFKKGIEYTPEGPAILHRGERIIPAGMNIAGVSNAELMGAARMGLNTTNNTTNNRQQLVIENLNLPSVNNAQDFMEELYKVGQNMGLDIFRR